MKTKQYQAVIVRLQGRLRDDEESLTDLLNERARAGWMFDTSSPLTSSRVLVVFSREA